MSRVCRPGNATMESTGQRNCVILRLEISDSKSVSDRALASLRVDVDYIANKQAKVEEAVRILTGAGQGVGRESSNEKP